MRLSQRNRNQTATRWTSSATDIYGNSSWTRSTLQVRWENRQQKSIDLQGNEFVSNSIVYVGEDIKVGDYLYLGTSSSDTPPTSSYEVKNFQKIPNLKATDYIRKAIL